LCKLTHENNNSPTSVFLDRDIDGHFLAEKFAEPFSLFPYQIGNTLLRWLSWVSLTCIFPYHFEELSTVSGLTLTAPKAFSTIVPWVIPIVTPYHASNRNHFNFSLAQDAKKSLESYLSQRSPLSAWLLAYSFNGNQLL